MCKNSTKKNMNRYDKVKKWVSKAMRFKSKERLYELIDFPDYHFPTIMSIIGHS